MATNADALAQGADDQHQDDPNAEGQQQDHQQQEEGADEGAEDPYAPLAQKMGWVPKDQFTGPPEQWKPAEQFILDGRDIQRDTARELKALRSTVETIGKTSATIVEAEVNRRVEELTTDYNRRVEDGDAAGAFKVAEQISALKAQPAVAASSAPPEAQAFAERNKSWFQKDPLATADAIEITNRLASQGYDAQTQLETAEREIKRRYPHLFGMNGTKRPAGVNEPGSRAPRSDSPNRQKGFADLPPEAQKIAADMVERKVIPDKEAYAKNYWANAAAPARRAPR